MMEDRITISQFEKGQKVQGIFFVKDCACKLTNGSNAKFLDMNLMDKTGTINAKLWDCKCGQEQIIKENILVNVKGNIVDWKGKLQFKIDVITPVGEDEEINAEDYIPVAPISAMTMYEDILRYKDEIKNDDIKRIVENILEKTGSKIMHYPAAKSNHHALRSGLLYHTTTMLKAGEALSKIYTFIDTDLLYAGIILHDIAKTQEMHSNNLGIVDEYTVEGQLLGHIIIGVRNIEVAANEVNADKEVSMLLQHMVLSHHYEAEYGSPKKPMFPEAELLHYLDILDARMYDMNKAMASTETGTFSDKIWSLENISIYKNNINREK